MEWVPAQLDMRLLPSVPVPVVSPPVLANGPECRVGAPERFAGGPEMCGTDTATLLTDRARLEWQKGSDFSGAVGSRVPRPGMQVMGNLRRRYHHSLQYLHQYPNLSQI